MCAQQKKTNKSYKFVKVETINCYFGQKEEPTKKIYEKCGAGKKKPLPSVRSRIERTAAYRVVSPVDPRLCGRFYTQLACYRSHFYIQFAYYSNVFFKILYIGI